MNTVGYLPPFEYRFAPSVTLEPLFDFDMPLNAEGILPETMLGLDERQISSLAVHYGNCNIALGALFSITIGPEYEEPTLVLVGDCSSVHYLGAKLSLGCIMIEGPIGRHLGSQMSRGLILAKETAGDWLGAEMKGGHITVRGNAGSQVGAAYRGSRKGMSGGSIRVEGDAGDEVGLLMRRGYIRIHGNSGSFAGASMIAGTIFVEGKLSHYPGAGMKRGTIITWHELPKLSPGFQFACEYDPTFLMRAQPEFKFRTQEQGKKCTVQSYRGDLMTGGRGELWHVLR